MRVVFESRDVDGAQMRDLSLERVRFALRRLTTFVPNAKVQFSDVNGPRGGVDKRCQLELKTDTAGTVVIASLARDWRTALDRSLIRATRVLTRSLQRTHKPTRGRVAKPALDTGSGNAL
ncbi:HPF/RaiA family ribosome-associated protein [Rhodoferax sp. PAMC 29310]|uniref:HPF/RaiA family ribosome-associated protein n=1 Tax=Rhodoferax sp. PAMC 29310 TaxID=2822760 RepID=UPI001B32B1F1|nr:HPF/RaiA family ribosome-associated protein [Rhodoferax sp. PAMC 29310]